MIHSFLSELLRVVGTLLGLALAGGFVVLPFRGRLRFVVLAAPLAGLLVVVTGIAALYAIGGLPFAACAAGSVGVCAASTIGYAFLARPTIGKASLAWAALAVLTVAPLVTWATDAATIQLGRPALLYTDGTDHLGYAQLADWIVAHPVASPPVVEPASAYADFPERMFRLDPRFGSFFAMALFEKVRGLSGAFSYDFACTVVLIAGVLAVAGAFARSPVSLALLVAGLLSCHWFDYTRGGYFAKAAGYPAALLVLGLYFATADGDSMPRVVLLAALTVGAALMHSGVVTALVLVSAAAPYLLLLARQARRSNAPDAPADIGQHAALLALLAGVAVAATGVLARPVLATFPDWHLTWGYILPRLIDLENQGVGLSGFSPEQLRPAAGIGFGIWAVLVALALLAQDAPAFGLLVGPALLVGGLSAAKGGAAAFQLIGLPFPLILCGAAQLIDEPDPLPNPARHRAWVWVGRTSVFVLAAAAVALHVPRLQGAVRRYAGADVNPADRFSKRQIDHLAQVIAGRPVLVETAEPIPATFALVELGRRGIPLQWTPRAWQTVVGYAHRPVPAYATPASLRLVPASQADRPGDRVLANTVQYKLLERTPPSF